MENKEKKLGGGGGGVRGLPSYLRDMKTESFVTCKFHHVFENKIGLVYFSLVFSHIVISYSVISRLFSHIKTSYSVISRLFSHIKTSYSVISRLFSHIKSSYSVISRRIQSYRDFIFSHIET